MPDSAYSEIVARSSDQQAQEASVRYLTEHLCNILRRQERVLICFQKHEKGNMGWLMEQAVLRCGAVPVVWSPEHKWKNLLRQAFSTKATVVIGEPLIVLGLTKLKKACGVPLYIRKVMTACYPCLDWMIDGIGRGFDCVVGGCFGIGMSGVVAGFACGHSWGVHLRDSVYGADIVNEKGESLPDGELGEIVLYPKDEPELRYFTGDHARMLRTPCKCGCQAPRLTDFRPGKAVDPDLVALGCYLQSWTSILDCRLRKGESGLEIELVTFPGEKLPRLPSTAKLVIKPLDLEEDGPFWYDPIAKSYGKDGESH